MYLRTQIKYFGINRTVEEAVKEGKRKYQLIDRVTSFENL
jgi:hypothetical protein